jgi:hypothetical protein
MAAACGTYALASETITGVVLNGTTGARSAGDDVVLLTIDHGSLEVSRSKTARAGSFRLHTDVLGKHLLRVRHEGVIYQQEVSSGVVSQIKVYDAVPDLAGVHEAVTVMKIESDGQSLNVTELHSVTNDSSPPRTLANASNLEVLLPAKSILDSIAVAGPSWHPEKVRPKPIVTGSAQYAVGYPLRPGITQFSVKYHLLFSDRAVLHPRLQYPTELWTVVFPKSMSFRALDKARFHGLLDQQGLQVQAVTKAAAGAVPGFVIAGIGLLPQIVGPPSAATVSAQSRIQPPPVDSESHINAPINASAVRLLPITRKPLVWYGIAALIIVLGVSLAKKWVAVRPRGPT